MTHRLNKPQEHMCASCECSSTEHMVHFDYQPPSYTLKQFGEVYMHVYLNPTNNLLKRIGIAARYVLGYRCKYGAWDETIIRKSAPKIVELLQKMQKDNEEYADWFIEQRNDKE